MVDFFLMPRDGVTAEVEAKRSRFLCALEPAESEEAARAVIERARKQHWDARHHCSAFVLGASRNVRRSNDDGEPSGTAGMPMLDVLVGAELTNVVAVVTRWFGGTLLGTGGLVKAYSEAVSKAVKLATIQRYERREIISFEVDVAEAGRIENSLRASGVRVRSVTYSTVPQFTVGIQPGGREALHAQLATLLGRPVEVLEAGEDWVLVT